MSLEDPRGGQIKSASLSFSAQVHRIDAIRKAAYRFCDLVSVDIAMSATEIVCRLDFLKPQSDAAVAHFLSNFKIEVLDQGLRSQISEETAAMRNAVLALAFSKTGLQGGE